MRKQTGFSLIELLIVVSIILIIAAIAIPGLLKARISANQASAVESMRTIMTANSAYQTSFGGYAPTILALGGPSPAACVPGVSPTSTQFCFLDATLAAATTNATAKSGYVFTYVVGGGAVATAYTLNADAAVQGQTGDNHYFADQTQVIRYNSAAAATASDATIQ
jgi:prepilin-type N-terminal cleavage/methylation domain-containing protein